MLLGLTEKVSLELGFNRTKSLSMADGKGKTVPGDRANVRKGALSLELLESVRNSESSSICRGAQCPRRDVQLKQVREVWRADRNNSVAESRNLIPTFLINRKPMQIRQKMINEVTSGCCEDECPSEVMTSK